VVLKTTLYCRNSIHFPCPRESQFCVKLFKLALFYRFGMGESELGFGFKVVFAGNSGVGKTSIIQRFCLNRFPESATPSLTSQFYERSFEIADSPETIDLMIYDTPGRDSLHLLAADSFQGCNICVVVYSFTDRASFEAVPQWVEKVKAVAVGVRVVLVENKIDILDGGEIDIGEAQRMAAQLEAPLFRLSVKEDLNVRPLFTYLAMNLHATFLSSLNSLPLGSDLFFVENVDDQVEAKRSDQNIGQSDDQAGLCSVQ
jgi:small GTP-binding protein